MIFIFTRKKHVDTVEVLFSALSSLLHTTPMTLTNMVGQPESSLRGEKV